MTRNEMHTRKGKIRFINALMEAMTKEIVRKVPLMPKEWDGHELRQYIHHQACMIVSALMLHDRRRKKAFDNAVLINNL